MATEAIISNLKLRKPSQYVRLPQSARHWIFQEGLDTTLHFPAKVAVTGLRPDIVVWSKATKTVILCELTNPQEEHAEEAHNRKNGKYQDLIDTCKERGYQSYC